MTEALAVCLRCVLTGSVVNVNTVWLFKKHFFPHVEMLGNDQFAYRTPELAGRRTTALSQTETPRGCFGIGPQQIMPSIS